MSHQEDFLNLSALKFNSILGVLDSKDCARIKRMIFRVSKGNAWVDFCEISEKLRDGEEDLLDPVSVNLISYFKNAECCFILILIIMIISNKNKRLDKNVFVIIYQGGSLEILKNKIFRICDSFDATRF